MSTAISYGNSTIHRLPTSGWDLRDLGPLVWVILSDIAAPIVTSYRGDLYRDAIALAAILADLPADADELRFFYGVRECGTSIGTDQALVRVLNPAVYVIDIDRDTDRTSKFIVTVTAI